ncbi:MAG: hypothetical protein ACREJ2_11620 [Planctomycetota bacterium]
MTPEDQAVWDRVCRYFSAREALRRRRETGLLKLIASALDHTAGMELARQSGSQDARDARDFWHFRRYAGMPGIIWHQAIAGVGPHKEGYAPHPERFG